jgi:hypothetical protein
MGPRVNANADAGGVVRKDIDAADVKRTLDARRMNERPFV